MLNVFISAKPDELGLAISKAHEKFQLDDVHLIYSPHINALPSGCKVADIYWLGKSITLMSTADIVFFFDRWHECKYCKIYHQIAESYKMKIVEESIC